jgi:hypothetical protein
MPTKLHMVVSPDNHHPIPTLLSPELYLNQYKRQRRIIIEQQWMKTQMNI